MVFRGLQTSNRQVIPPEFVRIRLDAGRFVSTPPDS